MTTPALAEFHHANLTAIDRVDRGPDTGMPVFRFRDFTGAEEEPYIWGTGYDAHPGLAAADRALLEAEYRQAHRLWAAARYCSQALHLIREAAPYWQRYAAAWQAMETARRALHHISDGMWHAAVLQLTEAQDAALEAARAWDDGAAARLARLPGGGDWPDLADAAAVAGIDVTGWHIATPSDYEPKSWRRESPLAERILKEIDRQRDMVQRAGSAQAGEDGSRR